MVNGCIVCAHKTLYTLANGYKKCAKCKKKFSPKKIAQHLKIVEGFCQDVSANDLAKRLNTHYVTVANAYRKCRLIIAALSQESFESHEHYIQEYDEYLYLPKYKKSNPDSIYEAHNFLIFDYGKIYTLTLPFSSKYLHYDKNPKELKNFLRDSKIAKLRSSLNTINEFCRFFESSIKKYKGVGENNFHYFLKEIEFKFNHPKEVRFTQLSTHYLKNF
jgi:hypothetical protein